MSALPLTSFPGSPSLDQFSFQTWLKVPEDKSAQAQWLGLKIILCQAQTLQLACATLTSISPGKAGFSRDCYTDTSPQERQGLQNEGTCDESQGLLQPYPDVCDWRELHVFLSHMTVSAHYRTELSL